jgi:RNA polymerase sigma-70 factor (ECF subfamily)
MGGDRFQEEAVLAAVKPLKTANLTPQDLAPSQNEESGTSHRDSSFRLAMVDTNTRETENANATKMAKAATEMIGLESLFLQHHDRVFRTAHRVTGSTEDAEDVLQTVFLRLARSGEQAAENIHHGDTENTENTEKTEGQRLHWSENPEAYLSRAAINASLDLLRKQKRSKAVAMDDVEQQASMTASSATANNSLGRNPEAHHEDRELRNLIREAVARLGEKAGAMFALRYFEGFDNGEIARMMNTSALVVGVTLHRARARLRKEIGNYMQKHST